MRIYLFFLFLFIFFILASIKSASSLSSSEIITIVAVHSYTYDNMRTYPQRFGFQKYLAQYEQETNVKFKIIDFFFELKTKNISLDSILLTSNWINEEINKINPDFIVTTDDISFEFIGIPQSKKYKIIFSGINKNFTEYCLDQTQIINISNISGVEENIDITSFLNLINNCKFIPDRIYILVEDPQNVRSETDYYIEKKYRELFINKYPIEIICIKGINNFRYRLKELNNRPRGIIILTLQRLPLEDTPGIYVDETFIIREILRFNKTHLELGENIIFSYFGYSICCASSFEDMGKLQAKILISSLKNKFDPKIYRLNSIISVNKKRLYNLGYQSIINNNLPVIDNIFMDY